MYVNIVSPEFKATVTSAIDNSCDSIYSDKNSNCYLCDKIYCIMCFRANSSSSL